MVTGDITQVDLPLGTRSGLADAIDRLARVEGVATTFLDRSDIVRHPLVQAIVNAYEDEESGRDREIRAEPPEAAGPAPAGKPDPSASG